MRCVRACARAPYQHKVSMCCILRARERERSPRSWHLPTRPSGYWTPPRSRLDFVPLSSTFAQAASTWTASARGDLMPRRTRSALSRGRWGRNRAPPAERNRCALWRAAPQSGAPSPSVPVRSPVWSPLQCVHVLRICACAVPDRVFDAVWRA
jgi:hypothetical protein